MYVPKALIGAVALSLLVSGHATASNDPVAANPNTGANFNRYAYANNNPYKFVDPDGREFKAPPSQQARLENEINSQTTQEFRFDSNSKLQSVGPSSNQTGSQTYTNALNDGISSGTTINLRVQQTVPGANGPINVDSHGGGLIGTNGAGELVVVISGNPLQTTDASGNAITDTPADTLRHEIAGHAVPQALANDAGLGYSGAPGNAIGNDNATRAELGKPLLAPDPSHGEYDP